MIESPNICANPACRIAETGKCAEGLSLEECSHYGKIAEAITDATESIVDLGPTALSLSNGTALSVPNATVLLKKRESRVIAVIGPRETGKTSLVAGIYDLFQT